MPKPSTKVKHTKKCRTSQASDMNDGIHFPECICKAKNPPMSKTKVKVKKVTVKACKNCELLKKIADCYASVIAAVYDGEKIENADKRIRKIYKL